MDLSKEMSNPFHKALYGFFFSPEKLHRNQSIPKIRLSSPYR
jgi:hypothetical protein